MNIKTTFSGVVTLKATALHSATFSSVIVSHPHLFLFLSLLLRLDSHIARPRQPHSQTICHDLPHAAEIKNALHFLPHIRVHCRQNGSERKGGREREFDHFILQGL